MEAMPKQPRTELEKKKHAAEERARRQRKKEEKERALERKRETNRKSYRKMQQEKQQRELAAANPNAAAVVPAAPGAHQSRLITSHQEQAFAMGQGFASGLAGFMSNIPSSVSSIHPTFAFGNSFGDNVTIGGQSGTHFHGRTNSDSNDNNDSPPASRSQVAGLAAELSEIREGNERIQVQNQSLQVAVEKQPEQMVAAVTSTVERTVKKSFRYRVVPADIAQGKKLDDAFAGADALTNDQHRLGDNPKTWDTIQKHAEANMTRAQALKQLQEDENFDPPVEQITTHQELRVKRFTLPQFLEHIDAKVEIKIMRSSENCGYMLYDTDLPEFESLPTKIAAGEDVDCYDRIDCIVSIYADGAGFTEIFNIEATVLRGGEKFYVQLVVMARSDEAAVDTITEILEITSRTEDVSRICVESARSEGHPFFKGSLEFFRTIALELQSQGLQKEVTLAMFRFTRDQHKELKALLKDEVGLKIRFYKCVFTDETSIPECIEEFSTEEMEARACANGSPDGKPKASILKAPDRPTANESSMYETPMANPPPAVAAASAASSNNLERTAPAAANNNINPQPAAAAGGSMVEPAPYDASCWDQYKIPNTRRRCEACSYIIGLDETPCGHCRCECMPGKLVLGCPAGHWKQCHDCKVLIGKKVEKCKHCGSQQMTQKLTAAVSTQKPAAAAAASIGFQAGNGAALVGSSKEPTAAATFTGANGFPFFGVPSGTQGFPTEAGTGNAAGDDTPSFGGSSNVPIAASSFAGANGSSFFESGNGAATVNGTANDSTFQFSVSATVSSGGSDGSFSFGGQLGGTSNEPTLTDESLGLGVSNHEPPTEEEATTESPGEETAFEQGGVSGEVGLVADEVGIEEQWSTGEHAGVSVIRLAGDPLRLRYKYFGNTIFDAQPRKFDVKRDGSYSNPLYCMRCVGNCKPTATGEPCGYHLLNEQN